MLSRGREGGRQRVQVLNIAHRGASAYAPENTIAAFEKACELGADAIELDLRQTLDEQQVIASP